MAHAMQQKLSAAKTSELPRSRQTAIGSGLRSPLRPATRAPGRLAVHAQLSDGGASSDTALSRRQAIAAGALGGLVSSSVSGGGLVLPRPARADEGVLAVEEPREVAEVPSVQEPAAAAATLAPAEQSSVINTDMDRVEIGRSGVQSLYPKP